ncbi:Zinc-finger homeodomain protein 4 [Zea mays]|uniref:Zinc-finger homeodomain protein 4 n=1 Tax=Zea mays TaxID=4577 RepID=A0A3L6F833_MAIZE|nr:Zinc-finger homeodomain protein 4 [Zea mays]
MVSIVPLQRTEASAAPARSIFSLERRLREEDDGSGPGGMDLSGTQGELAIPMHANVASPYGGGVGGHVLQLHRDDHGSNNGQSPAPLLPPPPAAAEETESSAKKRGPAAGAGGGGGSSAVKYRECLKNHAAAIGGNATDGCGEFMPSGEEGSLEALKCSACGCHRNFHRKEVDDEDDDMYGAAEGFSGLGLGLGLGHGHRAARRLLAPAMAHPHHKSGGGGLLISGADPYAAYASARALPPALPPPPGHAHHHHQYVMPLNMMHTSESDDMEGGRGGCGDAARGSGGSSSSRKRFRTKFTPEQKARMLEFAERVGWRLQKLDDGMVQAFCQEIGVKRRVLKVWMHNNKHNLATKRLEASPAQEQAMAGMASPPPPPPPPQLHLPLQMPAGVMPPPPPPPQAGSSCHRGGPGSPLPLKLE